MASSALSLIQAALERIGAYGPGQIVTAADSSRGLDQLNKLLDSLSNESLACFAISQINFTLIPGKTQYSIGTTGTPDINATRPLKIREGEGMAYVQDSNGNNYDVVVVPQSRWNMLGNRSVLTQSNVPSMLFYDPQFPLGLINIYPTPTVGYQMFVSSLLQLASMQSLTQFFNLPPGYELMLETALAEQLWPFFKSSEISATLQRQATKAKAVIKRLNKRNDLATLDDSLTGGGGYYNVYTDSYRPG